MICIDDLTFAYPGCRPVLDGLSLRVDTGEYVCLMGPNGSGKSTLAFLIKGLMAPVAGRISVCGISGESGDPRDGLMRHVGLVFQNPDNTIVSTTVEAELAFGLENLGVPRDDMRERVEDALRRFDLAAYRHVNPANLSGGEKQRLAFAAVLVMRPGCLVLDEPTALLDPAGRASLLDMIDEAVAAGTTVLHISQFAADARRASRLVVLEEGGITADGVPDAVMAGPDVARVGGMLWGEIPCPVAGDVRRAPTGDARTQVVSLNGVGYVYHRGAPDAWRALEGIRLDFPAGTATAILGPSGAGKSTLLEIIAGVTEAVEGRISVGNGAVRAMAFQLPEDQMFGDTVTEYVAFGPRNLGIGGTVLDDAVDTALCAVGLDPEMFRGRDPFALSGGQRRLAALAGILAMNPGVMVLDEPTAGLDRRGMERVLDVLAAYRDSGGTLIFSTHDFEMARCIADHAVVLKNGRVETAGTLEEVFASSVWLAGLEGSGV